MYFNIIASGSKGNATLICQNNTLILIDMGVTLTCLKDGLSKINKTLDDIDACFFTHDHSDHISGVQFLKNNRLYCLKGTLKCQHNDLELGQKIKIKNLYVTPIKTSHDAINPCGYIVESDAEKLVYITDTGFINEESLNKAKNPTYLILESNHDIKMLMASKRSLALKRRILSEVGHLCNEDSAIYACSLIGDKTKEIVLAHLSEECNTPEVALNAYKNIFDYYHVDFNKYLIKTAWQYKHTLGGNYED